MRKKLCLMVAVMVLVCGCGNANQNQKNITGNNTNDVTDETKESFDPNWEMPTEKEPNIQYLANVKKQEAVGNTVNIKEADGDTDFDITVNKVYTTNAFEEDAEQWNDIALEEAGVKYNQVIEEKQIAYIEYQVKNLMNETSKYCAADIKVIWEENGELYVASGELGYNSNAGRGRSANIIKIKPQETKTFRIGYILDAASIGKPKYLELSNSNSDTDFVIIPIEENE